MWPVIKDTRLISDPPFESGGSFNEQKKITVI